MNKKQSKLKIIWSMKSWSLKYINWRLTTAYPRGWKYIIFHPFELIYDLWKYLTWCQEFDCDVKR